MDAKPTRLRKKATREEILASLPVQARVRPARWVFLWVLLVACTALFIWVIFRPPEDVSAGFGVWRGLSFIALPLCLVLLPAATMSVFRPRHVTFDETRDWSVDWADVKEVGGAGAQAEHTFQVCLVVGKKLWNEGGLRKANRWDSGRPLQSGGLTNPDPAVRTQAALAPSALTLFEVFDELKKRNRRAGSPR
ncbi:hypothetical protein [Micrococcus luteus]|uniref:hypothetical protein n=1 Tax=Micrococcus luteus TaxID=1270 RepID=UPI001D0C34B3|nr:hypothetical protein [Micrococcus luteus]MCC0766486.1 hypothetical protein [Micrococcus luteus]